MTTALVVRRGGAGDALLAAGALALAGVMTLLVPVLGAVRPSDGAPTWFAPGALWVMLLPAALTAVLAVRRPVAALAVAAGAGLVGAVRLLADLPVVTSPDSLARPDLFVETTDRSLPFHPAGGGYLLLAADAVALAAGVFAAMRLSGRLSFQRDSDLDRAAGSDLSAGGLVPGREADETAPDRGDDDRAGRPPRNYLMTAAGFVGVLLLAVGALTVPYRGGYLASRYIEVGIPLAGLIAAVLLAVLAATAVLVGGSLPRTLAMALLGGVALAACLPVLAAVVAVVTAPVQLATTVWLTVAGAILLAAAGLLARVTMVRAGDDTPAVAAPSPAMGILAGVVGVVAGGLAAAAFALPLLDAGGLEDLLVLSDGSRLPGATLFLAAAVPLAVAGLLALVPATARAGRAALMVVWAAAVPAVTGSLQTLGDDGISTARLMDLVSIGSGTWCGVAALVMAVVAAVLAAVTSHRAAQASATVPDDDSVASARAVTVPLALGLGGLTVVAALLPVFDTAGQVRGPSLLRGYTVETWGVWALVLATIGALAGAAVTRRRWVALALGLAAAAVQAVRLVIPAGVPELTGFGWRPGAVLQLVLVLALIVGAVLLAERAGRVVERDDAGFDNAWRAGQASQRASSQAAARTANGSPAPRRQAGRVPSTARGTRSTSRNRRKRR